jgi:hypothetical protein
MLALTLYLVFGTRAALGDVLTELIVGLAVIGGTGGGRRLSVELLRFLTEIRRRRVPALSSTS